MKDTILFTIYALWCAIQTGPLDEADGSEQDAKHFSA
jgi:hypothetical protein